ncbi:MAG: peptidase S41, partial [Lutispora sp.]
MKITVFTCLVFICFNIAGCSLQNNFQQLGRDKDHEFDHGSGIHFTSISDKKVVDLAKLCKVWGIVKYYHPK